MEGEIDLRDVFGFIRRQIKIILVTVVVVVGAAAFFTITMVPTYTATTLVSVDPSSKNVLVPDTQFGSTISDNARIDGEVELAQSENVLLSVIARENLLSDPEFQPKAGLIGNVLAFLHLRDPAEPTEEQAQRRALNQLASHVTVQRRGSTYLMSISAQSNDREKAARLANAVATAYIEGQLRSKVDSTLKARDVIQSQIGIARATMVHSEDGFDAFIDGNLLDIIAQTGNTELATLSTEASRLRDLRRANSANLVSLQSDLATQDYTSLATRLADDTMASLARQRIEIASMLGNGTSLDADALRAQLAVTENQLNASATSAIGALQLQVAQTQQQESQLRQSVRTALSISALSPDVLTQIYDLQQTSELARQQYDTLLARAHDLEAQAAMQLADSHVVSVALTPGDPSFPNTRLILAFAAVTALAIGIGIAFIYEHFIGGITSERQLASVLRTPLAFAVPREKLVEPDQVSLSDRLIDAPLSVYSETIRRVRAAADQAIRRRQPDAEQGGVVMITSSAPNEGKTTIALSLARSYALSGQRTLIIDCDLRKPSLHRHLEAAPSHALITILTDGNLQTNLRSALVADVATGLMALLGARRSDVPTDQFIASRQFQSLIDAARNSFDMIILDTPPLGPVVDGIYLAPFASAVVLVVRAGATPQTDLRKSAATLDGAMLTGTEVIPVLNLLAPSALTHRASYGDYYVE